MPQNAFSLFDSVICLDILTSIEFSKKNIISIYPSPFYDMVYIENLDLIGSLVELSIYDLYGKRVWKSRMAVLASESLTLNLSSLPSGFYIFNATCEERRFNQKLVKLQ